jgi:hypothetical protein
MAHGALLAHKNSPRHETHNTPPGFHASKIGNSIFSFLMQILADLAVAPQQQPKQPI